MSDRRLVVGKAIIFALAFTSANSLTLHADEPGSNAQGAVQRKPFSAVSFMREVKVLSDGNHQFIRNLRYPIRLARDPAGRVRLDVVLNPDAECNEMELLAPPVCSEWSVVIFDPHTQTVTHWVDGERGYHGPVVIKLRPSQLEDGEHSTAAMPAQPKSDSFDDPDTTFEKLGDREIQGILATGTRVTNTHWIDQAGSRIRKIYIHEVWTSEPMQLVVRIVDGDPSGEEVIAGLEHVSLKYDPTLFKLPQGYPVRQTDKAQFADEDVSTVIASWFVQLSGKNGAN